MWAVFNETGIFASACRHGQILWITDMIRSGKLAKYPLAIIAKAMEILEDGQCTGYDISCSFEDTIKRSTLGPQFTEKNFKICVNAFHGYTHCYTCQLTNHPNVIPGAGLEDFETLERIFSASNQLASVTRYATPFRRHQLIDDYFRQWDAEKYANTGTFLLNNYTQALDIIRTGSIELAEAFQVHDLTNAILDEWEQKEKVFFAQLGKECEWDTYAVVYVQALQELSQLEVQRSNATHQFIQTVPVDYVFVLPSQTSSSYSAQASATARLETKRRRANTLYERVLSDVIAMEIQMGIDQRWTPTCSEYVATAKYIKSRRYHQALEKLHRLVVLRLFELHKLNLSRTSMCSLSSS